MDILGQISACKRRIQVVRAFIEKTSAAGSKGSRRLCSPFLFGGACSSTGDDLRGELLSCVNTTSCAISWKSSRSSAAPRALSAIWGSLIPT